MTVAAKYVFYEFKHEANCSEEQLTFSFQFRPGSYNGSENVEFYIFPDMVLCVLLFHTIWSVSNVTPLLQADVTFNLVTNRSTDGQIFI